MLRIVLVTVVVHGLLFFSIFDIYFRSPIEHGMVAEEPSISPPPAKRVVLFVADGLRADTFYSLRQDNEVLAPFLRDVIEKKGAWGVSHTRVPTESRPGHVAIIAGFYEDVSAVTRGWQENPVEFDSVFNCSTHTWSWGSPDILPMFAKGAAKGRVSTFMYEPEYEDFAASDASKLDKWVFDEVEEFFRRAKDNSDLKEELEQEGLVFFLHLLGIDTNGHAHRPASSEYIDNVRSVDKGIEKMVELFEDHFADGRTAYVFTSDHGMTDWGSHGAGLADETMTPLVAWGAGVRTPILSAEGETGAPFTGVNHTHSSHVWKLDHLVRSDVKQADITPLMSVLIGRPIPVNNEGVLPVSYLLPEDKLKTHSLFTNAMQLCEQVRVKHDHIAQTSLGMFLRPYPKLDPLQIKQWRNRISSTLNQENYSKALRDLNELVEIALEAIKYYNKYHRTYLFIVISCAFVGWMASIGVIIAEEFSNFNKTTSSADGANDRKDRVRLVVTVFTAAGFVVVFLLFLQSSPILHYVYTLLSLLVWVKVVLDGGHFVATLLNTVFSIRWWSVSMLLRMVVLVIFIEGIVLSFFHRWSLSVLLLLASFWPFFTSVYTSNRTLCLSWLLTCVILAVFPLLPTVGRDQMYLFVHLASLVGFTSVLLTHRIHLSRIVSIQLFEVMLASVIVEVMRRFISWKMAVPYIVHISSWVLLVKAPIVSLLTSNRVSQRLLSLFLALFVPYLLLSTSFEALFVLLFAVLLYQWISIEHILDVRGHKVCPSLGELELSHKAIPSSLQLVYSVAGEDVRRITMALFFGVLSFFATGNIASINTFDPSYVYCFKTVFSPFIMGGLIIFKIAIPFLLVGFALNVVLLRVGQPHRLSVLLAMVVSDVMGLQFFFLVRDEGSWLDIGISISHYVIIMCVAVGVVVMMLVARIYTGTSLNISKPHQV